MTVVREDHLVAGEPVVELIDVSRRFIKRRERTRSLQDKFIRLLSRRNAQLEEFWPMRHISFTLRQGECVGVIGPNGAGKSTFLKLVTGILTPTAGDMVVRGRVSSLLELGAGFHPDLTGRENIYLNGSIYGLNRSQINARIDHIIEYAELGDFIDTPIKHYSSGMYVRLGFAVAIHTDPDLLLVDEVLAVGDAGFQRKCLNSIRHFRQQGGTLLFISHDLNTVQSICDRVIWLEEGHIQADGKPIDVVMAYLSHMAQKEEARRRAAIAETSPAASPESTPGAAPQPIVSDHRWGSGRIRIEAVELCNNAGQEQTIFRTGEPMLVRMHYRTWEPIERPVFGVAMHDVNGVHLCGPNSDFGGLRIPAVQGSGTVTYRIDTLPLLEGDYFVSVAAVDHQDREMYDYHDRLYRFRVQRGSATERYGLFAMNGGWAHVPDVLDASTDSIDQPAGTEDEVSVPAR